MTGVKIDQWQGNIGLFNRKKLYKMCHVSTIMTIIFFSFLCYGCAPIPHSTYIVGLLLLLRALSFSILFFLM